MVEAPALSRRATVHELYQARLASTTDELRAAQALRFRVFNLELGEGLARSYETGRDVDRFDAVCDHLIVTELTSGEVVGTYRLQTGSVAAQYHGYYSEREFDFGPYEALRGEIVELGRACIDVDHRNFAVLNLLWSGIADYAAQRGARYLVGCSSLTSQDPAVGAAAWKLLMQHQVSAALRTQPQGGFVCALDVLAPTKPHIPRLLAAYLGLGAEICGPPAIDREFGTIDYLTWLDLRAPRISELQRRGRFAPG
jgi:putative hemolysin